MQNQNISHYYSEIGGELLAKPQALGEILEAQGYPPTLIFCNSPSDTDLVEVLLKKKGIGATKLIGHVPPVKVARALERIASKEISALVVTDIAARGLDLNQFGLLVNYAVHNDPELYLHRCGLASSTPSGDEQAQPATPPASQGPIKVLSLVSPLDIANFHYLKKFVEFEFQKLELPTKQDLARARIENLRAKAVGRNLGSDQNWAPLVGQVLSNADKEHIVAFLLFNSFEAMPQLSADLEKVIAEKEQLEMVDESYLPGQRMDDRPAAGHRPQRGGAGGHPQGGRRDRDRQGGGGSGGARRGPRSQGGGYNGSRYDSHERGDDEGRPYDDEGPNAPEPSGMDSSQEGGRFRRKGPPQRIREDRLYIGIGSRAGLTEEKFSDLVESKCGLSRQAVKRFSLRDNYSFADLPEENSALVVEKLNDSKLDNGAQMFVKKAVTITTTLREPTNPDGGEDGENFSQGFDEENQEAL